MNTLARKEVRLLMPSYIAALLLATVPSALVWFTGEASWGGILFCFGGVVLGISSFGREFSLGTSGLMLAQPVRRGQIWWTKIAVLAVAMATVFIAGCLSWAAYYCMWPQHQVYAEKWGVMLGILAMMAAATFAGGLWTSVLLRQVAAAFWITILAPAVLQAGLVLCGWGDLWMVLLAYGIYSVGGFLFAWRLFLRAQDIAWTGGVIALPAWRSADAVSDRARGHRPLRAMIAKELQLHQISLIGIGAMFLLHLGTVIARKLGHGTYSSYTEMALEIFSGLWLLAPAMVGTVSVAEERRLGTMDANLCLPVSTRVQFLIKLFLTLAIGALLTVTLGRIAEEIGKALGVRASDIFTGWLLAAFLGLAFVAFYASTLTRNLLQSIGATITALCVVGGLTAAATEPTIIGGLWQGPLVYWIAIPTLTVVLLWLAYQNFRSVAEVKRVWRRNAITLIASILFITSATAAIYNRAWSWFSPLEPPHGAAVLSGNRPKIASMWWGLAVVLPDGRLWEDRYYFPSNDSRLAASLDVGWRWASWTRNHFFDVSNVTDAVITARETVALRSDGTLWISGGPWRPPTNASIMTMVQFGHEAGWKRIVSNPELGREIFLLRQDGTLWTLGVGDHDAKNETPSPRKLGLKLRQYGNASDWAEIIPGIACCYAWKLDGSAWGAPPFAVGTDAFARIRSLDGTRWQSLTVIGGWNEDQVAVRIDGTMWRWHTPQNVSTSLITFDPRTVRPAQIGTENDWAEVATGGAMLVALKKDGTLWRWKSVRNSWVSIGRGRYRQRAFWESEDTLPHRLGIQSDWLAIATMGPVAVSLSSDGSLWSWGVSFHGDDQPKLIVAPSRKPLPMGNIFAGAR